MRSRKSTEVRKEEIVRAALFLVEQNGLDKLNIIDIAVEVKLVPAAIYRHFKGKEDIVAALIEFTDKCLQCNLSQAMDYDGTAIVKLKLLFELHVKLLKEEAAIPRILYFLLSSERNPELKVGMLSAFGSYVQQVKKCCFRGRKKERSMRTLMSRQQRCCFLAWFNHWQFLVKWTLMYWMSAQRSCGSVTNVP